MIKLFVYGTLRNGATANALLASSILEEKEYKLKNYALYDFGEYPFAIPGDCTEFVIGDIYLVDEETLKCLDEYEGEMYVRVKDDHTQLLLYIKSDRAADHYPKIISGDWLIYSRQNIL